VKRTVSMLGFIVVLAATGQAFADADDVKWINQCIKDNKDEGAKAAVVRKYCECMNNMMDASETRSITEWEKTHKKERDDCSRKAGWK
jgi:hypothetical protein